VAVGLQQGGPSSGKPAKGRGRASGAPGGSDPIDRAAAADPRAA